MKARADIVQRFRSVFSEELGEFTRDVSLETDLAIPAEQTPLRKVPLAMQDRLKAELARLEDIGLLKKVTTPTKWVSSMVVAEKKGQPEDSSVYWPKAIELSTEEEHIPTAHSGRCSSEACKSEGLFCMWPAKRILALQARRGIQPSDNFQHTSYRFRWTWLPFSVLPAPEIFQRKTSRATWRADRKHNDCRGSWHSGVWPRGDWGRGTYTPDKNLEQLLQRAEERGSKVNEGKFKYRLSEVCYAGDILSNMGVRADPKKTEAICNMPPPEDVAGVRHFGAWRTIWAFAKPCDNL